MTTLELAAHYQELHDKSDHKNGLWKGAYGWTARILRTYHRARAAKMLAGMAERYKHMSVSSVYKQAAETLNDRGGVA